MAKNKGKSRRVFKVNEFYQIGYVIEEGTGDRYPFLQDLTKNPEISRGNVSFELNNGIESELETVTKKVAVDLEDDDTNN